MTLQSLPVLVALAAACVGAVTDVWRFRVYNLLTFPLIFTGFFYHTLMDGRNGLAISVARLSVRTWRSDLSLSARADGSGRRQAAAPGSGLGWASSRR